MEVTINTVNQNIVTFSSEFGAGMAEWHGEIPKINSKYDVEFEIEELLTWGVDINQINEQPCSMYMENEKLIVIGRLESVDEDGYTVVRLGKSIIPLVVKDIPQQETLYVKALINNVILFPYQLS